jgi:excisionase family DNA binding protein
LCTNRGLSRTTSRQLSPQAQNAEAFQAVPSPPLTNLFLFFDEVAAFLDVDVRSVYQYMRTGRIAHVRIGRYIRVPKNEVERRMTRGTSSGC